jgi:PAS domain S-box-containing protein
MNMNAERELLRELIALCPSHLGERSPNEVAKALLHHLHPAIGGAGLFLLDVERGIFRRCLDCDWPEDLEELHFRPGDLLFSLLHRGPVVGGELRGCKLPARVEGVAPLLDERSKIRGLLVCTGAVDESQAGWIGGLAALLACLLRLSELPQEKEALRTYYGEVLDHLHEAVVLSDVEGLILHWNQGAEQLLGYRAGEVVSRGGNFLVSEGDLEQAGQVRRRAAAGEVIRETPAARLMRSGKLRDLLLTVLPVRNPGGEVIGVAEIMRPKPNGRMRIGQSGQKVVPVGVEASPLASSIPQMVGVHPSIFKLRQMVQKIAPMDSTTLILGESGTGKELVARAIHAQSPRRDAPFVAVNCAAIPTSLLESEMFGYERGAFTGATRRHRGLLEQANGGMVLLDEVAETPVETQVKLLRALQEKTIRRLGGNREIELDIRFVASTNRPIRRYVDEGRFREDLYYRLNTITLTILPLRQRLSDLPLLVRHGLAEVARDHGGQAKNLSSEGLRVLMEHTWPGNVRELFNVLERVYVLSQGATIEAADVRVSLPEMGPALRQVYDGDVRLSLEEVERRHMSNVLAEVGGNVKEAAEILGISRETVYKKMRKYDMRK